MNHSQVKACLIKVSISRFLSHLTTISGFIWYSCLHFFFNAVHDANALLVDNAAESGEESEDEWNYYKGDDATNKENIQPTDPDAEVRKIIT